jgi:hypothetical protein
VDWANRRHHHVGQQQLPELERVNPMNLRNRIRLMAVTAVALVAGCVTLPSHVVPIGKDTYQLSMTGVGFATQANTNVKALQEANDYCDKLGKHMVFQHNAEAGVYGWSPRQSSLTFLCVNADDVEYTRAKVTDAPAGQ